MSDQSERERDFLETIDQIHPADLAGLKLSQYEKIRDRRGGLRAGLKVSTDAPRLPKKPKEQISVEDWLAMPLSKFEETRVRQARGEVEITVPEKR